MKKALKLIGSILLCQSAGVIGCLTTYKSIPAWYAGLNKPSFNPPNNVFSPVWTILFTLMGISLFLVLEKNTKTQNQKRIASAVFAAQLILNTLWSIVFFGLHSITGAMAVIVLLWLAILATMIVFYRISKLSVLNASFIMLNN
jgi:tryptophan-rich sensory protein